MAGWGALAVAQPKSDWELQQEERSWTEGAFELPSYPKAEDLIEFDVGAPTGFRFFIDRASLSVTADGVVRYTLLARSRSGVDNVSYEGIRCKSGTYRTYAYGHDDRTWRMRVSPWRPIEPESAQIWRQALWREYFCPEKVPIADAAEGIDALRRGGHPHSWVTRRGRSKF